MTLTKTYYTIKDVLAKKLDVLPLIGTDVYCVDAKKDELRQFRLIGITDEGFLTSEDIWKYLVVLGEKAVHGTCKSTGRIKPYDLQKKNIRAFLRGKWYRVKEDDEEYMITCFGHRKDGTWEIDFRDAQKFMMECEWLNGEPCGDFIGRGAE